MIYSTPHYKLARRKIQEKKAQLAAMSGEDRTKLEAHLIEEARLEVEAEKKKNESLQAALDDKNAELAAKNAENETLQLQNMELEDKLKEVKVEPEVEITLEEVKTEIVLNAPAAEVKLDTPPAGVLPHGKNQQNKHGKK